VGEYGSNSNLPIELERTCSDIGLLTELFGPAQHLGLWCGVRLLCLLRAQPTVAIDVPQASAMSRIPAALPYVLVGPISSVAHSFAHPIAKTVKERWVLTSCGKTGSLVCALTYTRTPCKDDHTTTVSCAKEIR
jgi:hypothetical protein